MFAKKSTKGHYVVVEAIGGKNNPNIVPVMILQFNEEKLNEMFNFDKRSANYSLTMTQKNLMQ